MNTLMAKQECQNGEILEETEGEFKGQTDSENSQKRHNFADETYTWIHDQSSANAGNGK